MPVIPYLHLENYIKTIGWLKNFLNCLFKYMYPSGDGL